MRFLENMKQRSNEVKSRIAIVCAFVITGVIALVWVSTIPARLEEVSKAYEESNTTESAKSALTDLVEQVKQNAPLQNEFDTEEEDPSSFTEPQGASALDALMREGFDPEAVKVSSTSSDQDTVLPPPVTAESESSSSETVLSPVPVPVAPTSPVPLPSEVVHMPTSTPTTTKPVMPPPPRMILIGTTTSSKR